MRTVGVDQTGSVWHRAPQARSSQGQNSLWTVLGNPSFSAIKKKPDVSGFFIFQRVAPHFPARIGLCSR